jgi:Cu-processing system permease protein
LKVTAKIIKYELHDVFRSKWVILYTLFFLATSDILFRFSGNNSSVVLSLMNIVLIFIPLVSIIFGTMYVYHSREFLELLLSQPLNRVNLFYGMYLGIALPLSAGFAAGVIIPGLYHEVVATTDQIMFITLILSGLFLTFIFTALAFFIAISYEDRVRGLGVSILLWLFFAVMYDGIILWGTFLFKAYPLEKPLIALTLFNPIDLARILLLLKFDISALMGYTGAVFQKFFGSHIGIIVSTVTLILWTLIPFFIGLKRFAKKDF